MAVKADITIDIDKQVGNLQNLTNIYNARVGDNKTPLTVLWRKNGMALNLKGLHAFIAGKVGDGSYNAETDKVDFPVGTPVVKYEDDGSGTLDNGQSGLTTLLIPKQMWAKTGLFAGYIGLKDENGSVFTSKDIFFKVLGNVLDAGVAINYFIDDFSNVIQNSKLKLQETIDDAQNTYESETKNAHDSLDALKLQIQANRDEQENLAQHLAGTEQQIETHDVVTRPEFLNISNLLTQQVSQMKEAGLEFFNNADDLKAKYPNGANKLCVTLNDSHEWVYDYANGQWNDAGAFNYGTIDPKLTSAIFQPNPDNLIKNSQFITTDFWNPGRDKTDPDYYIEPTSKGNAIVINGYVADGSTNESWITTDPIEVSDSKYISVGADIALSGIDYSNGKSAMIGFDFTDKEGKHSYYNRYIPASLQDGQFHKITEMHITYPADTVSVAIAFALWGYGTMKIRKPQASFSNVLNPYSSSDLETKLALTDSNLLISQPAKDWDFTLFYQKYTVDYDNVITLDCSNAVDTDYNIISSDYIAVNPNDQFAANVEAQINSTNSTACLEIWQFANADDSTKNQNGIIDQYFVKTNELTDFVFDNIELQPSTKFIKINIVTHGKAILQIGKISLKKKTDLDLARDKVLRSQNLAYDFSYKNWRSLFDSNLITASENDETVQITSTDPNYGGLQSSNIAVDATKPLNISFNAKSDHRYDSFESVEIGQIDQNNETTPDKNIDIYNAWC